MKCFYCNEIIKSNKTIDKILETRNILAYYHTKPSYKFHVVIVPKKHIISIFELDNYKLLLKIFKIAEKIIKDKKLDKYRIITNGGQYQEEKHLHFHLVSEGRIK